MCRSIFLHLPLSNIIFQTTGVELTLEKLFLDLINEPLKVLQDFMTPQDHTPNFLSMGSKKCHGGSVRGTR